MFVFKQMAGTAALAGECSFDSGAESPDCTVLWCAAITWQVVCHLLTRFFAAESARCQGKPKLQVSEWQLFDANPIRCCVACAVAEAHFRSSRSGRSGAAIGAAAHAQAGSAQAPPAREPIAIVKAIKKLDGESFSTGARQALSICFGFIDQHLPRLPLDFRKEYDQTTRLFRLVWQRIDVRPVAIAGEREGEDDDDRDHKSEPVPVPPRLNVSLLPLPVVAAAAEPVAPANLVPSHAQAAAHIASSALAHDRPAAPSLIAPKPAPALPASLAQPPSPPAHSPVPAHGLPVYSPDRRRVQSPAPAAAAAAAIPPRSRLKLYKAAHAPATVPPTTSASPSGVEGTVSIAIAIALSHRSAARPLRADDRVCCCVVCVAQNLR